MRIVFMGTGEIALPTFKALVEQSSPDIEIVGLITQPDRPVGRHMTLTPPPLKPIALAHHIPVLQPESLRTPEALAEYAALKPDLTIVMAYGQILTQSILDIPTKATINLHGSLLPRHRGASCIQSAIDKNDATTGFTLMHVVKALDAGNIIDTIEHTLTPESTGGEVHDRLAELASELLLRNLPQFLTSPPLGLVQEESLVTYSPKLLRSDGIIDWALSAERLNRRIRAYDPWPGTSTFFVDAKGKKRSLKIFAPTQILENSGTPGCIIQINNDGIIVACGKGSLLLKNVQPEGSKRMTAAQFAHGLSNLNGQILG